VPPRQTFDIDVDFDFDLEGSPVPGGRQQRALAPLGVLGVLSEAGVRSNIRFAITATLVGTHLLAAPTPGAVAEKICACLPLPVLPLCPE